ncbi:conserved hypothetical protein [Crocosphaera subtropica ATCC 51142]|uniref:Uncharacterized protein n=1 Tax=Crocosphaera subtropica (strain ATCC 51142 / BH68) TaxID=43989 RepID=B1WUC5_CROS5|nr:hypothetical protein [Crocosphaera subtropica]ACB53779.1 conserved hypothetical protein [Crocosphaera subtropica ATCC 51142]
MQVSLRSKPIVDLLSTLSLSGLKYGAIKVISLLLRKQPRTMLLWSLGSMGTTLMLAWNPKLVGATLTGLGLMGLVYWVQTTNWQNRWLYWYQFFNSSQGKLAIAVITGGFGAISSYIALYIWSNAENQWLATGLIFQGLGTFLTLGLLGWQIFDLPRKKQENQYQEWVSQLSDANELKRLIAIDNLLNLLEKRQLTVTQIQKLSGYFRLMLNQETEMTIREAMLQFFQRLEQD